MTINKSVKLLFILLALSVVAFFIYLPNYTKLKKLKMENLRLGEETKRLREQIAELQDNIKRLDSDPYIWERLARQHLGVIKEGEIVVDINQQEE